MGFLRDILDRPQYEKPVMIVVTGHPTKNATISEAAPRKRPVSEIISWH